MQRIHRMGFFHARHRRAFIIIGIAVFVLMITAQRALDASTSRRGGASDYLTWLLRSEDSRSDTKPAPRSIVMASLPKKQSTEGYSSLRNMAATGRPVPRNMAATGRPVPRKINMAATGRPVPRKNRAVTGRSSSQAFSGSRAVIERVRAGDTLSSIMQRYGVSLQTSLAMVWAAHQVFNRSKTEGLAQQFQAGRLIKLTFDREDRVISLDYPVSHARTLHVFRGEDGSFSANLRKTPLGAVEVVRKPSARNPVHTIIRSLEKDRASRAKKKDGASRTKRENRVSRTNSNPSDFFKGAARQIQDTVRSGDFLTSLLARHGVTQATAFQVAKGSKPVFDLARTMIPGNKIRLGMDKNGRLMGLVYPMDEDNLLWLVRRDDTHFTPHIQKKKFETRLKRVSGGIREDGSLFLAGKKAGISQSMVIELARLFEWDVDFARDIRAGDKFKVVYEVKYYQGSPERDGKVMAAEFINQGRPIQVFRYTDPSGSTGYYDTGGRNARKMFIRAPVDFTRISSLFSKQRKHPVYGFTRAHKGVDYAAPRGTPVRSAGDGQVTFAKRNGGYGLLVLIRHNSTYTTAYAHLSAFSPGLKVGKRVKQGDVIGQVGSTGASTGPHLHYEVRVNKKQVNPLSVQLPTANPIPAKYREDFRFHRARMLAMLDAGEIQLAELSASHARERR